MKSQNRALVWGSLGALALVASACSKHSSRSSGGAAAGDGDAAGGTSGGGMSSGGDSAGGHSSGGGAPDEPLEPTGANCGDQPHGTARWLETECEGGRGVEVCDDGTWTTSSLCAQEDLEDVSVLLGYESVEWDFSDVRAGTHGAHGFSYYLRAFDLVRDTPVREYGWGQWSKAGFDDSDVQVCAFHPRTNFCEEPVSASDPAGCRGSTWQELATCADGCNEEEGKGGVRGRIEGGMGYWMYTLETPHVKWNIPGGANQNYEYFAGTYLADISQPCTNMGGAVRVSNQLLVPNDFLSFEGDTINGFGGYMLTRTPIGKRSATDDANHWTIILDTANFSGPALYLSSWFWDARTAWHPDSMTWADPRAGIGNVATGTEGGVSAAAVRDTDGTLWFKTNRIGLPRDKGADGTRQDTFTTMTGHRAYRTDWASTAVEDVLEGRGNLAAVAAAAAGAGELGTCAEESEDLILDHEAGEQVSLWPDVGVKGSPTQLPSGDCPTRFALDTSKLDCETTEGWCELSPYLQISSDGTPVAVDPKDVPLQVRGALDLPKFEPTRRNDGRFLGPPAETEKACFEMPGPADETLYCTRTDTGTWIAFQWYRFVDQPELNQVFASLPESEQDEARCFMQARIEALHQAERDAAGVSHWFDAPEGVLPEDKVELDHSLILEPPAGLEVGFVPVPIMERQREVPVGCDVFLGDHESEPNPLPEGHWDEAFEGFGYQVEVCTDGSNMPGEIFPYEHKAGVSRTAYQSPLRENVGSTLPAQGVMCGLPSDPN